MPFLLFSSWSWPHRLLLLGGILMPFILGAVLFEVNAWRPRTLLKADTVGDILYSPTEPLLACTLWGQGNNPGKIQMWDAQHAALLWSHNDSELDTGTKFVFSPDGTMLASATGEVVIWDARTGRRIASIPNRGDVYQWSGVTCPFQFSPDGKTLQIGNAWFDAKSGRLMHKLSAPSYYALSDPRVLRKPPFSGKFRTVQTLRMSPDHKSGVRLLVILENDKGKLREDYVGYSEMPSKAALTFGYQLWLCDSQGNLQRQLQTAKDVDTLKDVLFSPDGRWLVVSSSSVGLSSTARSEPQIWDAHTGKTYCHLTNTRGEGFDIASIQWSRDGRHLFTTTDSVVAEWERKSGKIVRSLNLEEKQTGYFVLKTSVSPDGSTLASVGAKWNNSSTGPYDDCAIRLWRLK